MTPHQRAGIVRLLADAFAASPKMTRIALYTDDTGLRKLRYPCSDRTPPSHLLQPEHTPPLTDAERAAKDGACCYCGYSGSEESSCPKRSDGVHCDHWWGSDDESPAATPTEEVVPSDPVPVSGLPVAPGGDVTTPSSPDVAALLAQTTKACTLA